MNIDFDNANNEELTPLETILVRIKNEFGIESDVMSVMEKYILSVSKYFMDNPDKLEEELENIKNREEPKNIVFHDFSA